MLEMEAHHMSKNDLWMSRMGTGNSSIFCSRKVDVVSSTFRLPANLKLLVVCLATLEPDEAERLAHLAFVAMLLM